MQKWSSIIVLKTYKFSWKLDKFAKKIVLIAKNETEYFKCNSGNAQPIYRI